METIDCLNRPTDGSPLQASHTLEGIARGLSRLMIP